MTSGRVLVVDDDETVRELVSAQLAHDGHSVETASNAEDALAHVARGGFDVILTDIGLPGISGIEFLRQVRERDLDVPVVLMTGDPRLETAIHAVEYGAAQYLVKPVALARLREEVRRALRLGGLARLKREAMSIAGFHGNQLGDRAALEARFAHAMETLWAAFQPIVSWKERKVVAYEALLRCDEPTLPRPEDILEAAGRLGRMADLGRTLRRRVATAAQGLPGDTLLFVNLAADDFGDEDLFDPKTPLAPLAPRVVLEVTERAPLDRVPNIHNRVQKLRQMGFRIAVDDLGAGYAGLSSLVQLDPEVVKLDMELIRGIDTDEARQRVIRSMVELCRDLKMQVVIEGVQTPEERDTLLGYGCDLLQGYLFARPNRAFLPAVF